MTKDIPELPGYVSTKEAAKLLSVSERRIRFYIEVRRLNALRAADVLLIPLSEIQSFKRKIVGRPRKTTPTWRISATENAQFMTTVLVHVKSGKEQQLERQLEEIRRSGKYIFPGTIARYITESETTPGQIGIVLIWRNTVMPSEAERQSTLEMLQQELSDVLDWHTAQYDHSKIFMHT